MDSNDFRFQAPQRKELLELLPAEGVDHLEDACNAWLGLPLPGVQPNHWREVKEAANALRAALKHVDLCDAGQPLESSSHFEMVREIVARGYGNRFADRLLIDLVRAADFNGAGRSCRRRGPGAPRGNHSVLVLFCAAIAMRFGVVRRPSRSSDPFMRVMDAVFAGLKEPNGPRFAVQSVCDRKRQWVGDMFGTRDGGVYSIERDMYETWISVFGTCEESAVAGLFASLGHPIPPHLAAVPKAEVQVSPARVRRRELP